LLKNTGHLFQEAALLANMSIYDNIALPLRYHTNMPENEIKQKVWGVLGDLKLRIETDLRPASFPMSARKMAALARVLVMEPAMLFLDEPTSGLDRSASETLLRLCLKLKQEGKTTALIVSDDEHFISRLADRILVLHEGEIIADGTMTEIYASTDPYVHSTVARIGQDNTVKTDAGGNQ
jgi:phospholipid/cholesterol/gamma-HCH transport system ATP-binding protein